MEIWSAGERAYNMARAFNAREGFGPDDDVLPERLFEKLPDGPKAGIVYDKQDWLAARDKFYALAGWDAATGAPTRAKLEDLDVAWVADLLEATDS
jgi:aldehyde:ferredoxin oxidoreductase